MSDERRYRELERRVAALEAKEVTPRAGTWTPTFTGTGTAGTFTYVDQDGIWARVGPYVYVAAFVQISAIAVAPTGTVEIGGLPYAVAATAPAATALAVATALLTYTGQLWADVLASGTRVRLGTSTSGAVTPYPASSFTLAPAHIGISGWYRAA